MSDPTDWSTFTELSEYVFPEITASTGDDDHSHWNHYTLSLFGAKLKGKYIAFATDYKATNYAYIDNIVVEAQTGCGAPSGLNVVDSTLTATTAEVVWVSNKLKWNKVKWCHRKKVWKINLKVAKTLIIATLS